MSTREQGVAVMMGRDTGGVPHWEHSSCEPHRCEPGRWFSEPVAARLIDPDDPKVRERLHAAFDYRSAFFNPDHIVDIALDALRGGAS